MICIPLFMYLYLLLYVLSSTHIHVCPSAVCLSVCLSILRSLFCCLLSVSAAFPVVFMQFVLFVFFIHFLLDPSPSSSSSSFNGSVSCYPPPCHVTCFVNGTCSHSSGSPSSPTPPSPSSSSLLLLPSFHFSYFFSSSPLIGAKLSKYVFLELNGLTMSLQRKTS